MIVVAPRGDKEMTTPLREPHHCGIRTENVVPPYMPLQHHTCSSHHNRPLWPFIHDADKAKLAHSLSVVILGAASSSTIAVRGRVRTAYEDTYVDLDMAVSAGTQGIHCRMWKK